MHKIVFMDFSNYDLIIKGSFFFIFPGINYQHGSANVQNPLMPNQEEQLPNYVMKATQNFDSMTMTVLFVFIQKV